jgi:hypothetical protein
VKQEPADEVLDWQRHLPSPASLAVVLVSEAPPRRSGRGGLSAASWPPRPSDSKAWPVQKDVQLRVHGVFSVSDKDLIPEVQDAYPSGNGQISRFLYRKWWA